MSSFCSTSFLVAELFGFVLSVFSIGSTIGGIDASTANAWLRANLTCARDTKH